LRDIEKRLRPRLAAAHSRVARIEDAHRSGSRTHRASWRSQNASCRARPTLWAQASLENKQRLQQLFSQKEANFQPTSYESLEERRHVVASRNFACRRVPREGVAIEANRFADQDNIAARRAWQMPLAPSSARAALTLPEQGVEVLRGRPDAREVQKYTSIRQTRVPRGVTLARAMVRSLPCPSGVRCPAALGRARRSACRPGGPSSDDRPAGAHAPAGTSRLMVSSSVRRPHWPRWRDALVLVQPATVDHWHLEGSIDAGGVGCDVLENRASIRNVERGLIRQMAAENRLWGAPRILRRTTQAGAHSLRTHGVALST